MSQASPPGVPAPPRGGAYTYSGAIHFEYSPELDHEPDPGEIVWTWVAFEEDAGVGKDRPVAVLGRTDDRRLVALMLSSHDHDGDRRWLSIGAGPWDQEGRESWVRADRVLAVAADSVRREGSILPRATYDRVVAQLRASVHPVTSQLPTRPRTAPPVGLASRLRRLFGRNGA